MSDPKRSLALFSLEELEHEMKKRKGELEELEHEMKKRKGEVDDEDCKVPAKEPKTKFLLTYKDDNLSTEAASLVVQFTDEPNAMGLRERVKNECQLTTLLPLFYYSTSGRYEEVPKSGQLPSNMQMNAGEIQLRLAMSATSPPTSPVTKNERQRANNLDAVSFTTRVLESVRTKRPHICLELYDELFVRIPLLLEDKVFEKILDNLRASEQAEDAQIIVLFAVPGAGKSRTIRESSTRFGEYKRIKMNDGKLLKVFQEIAQDKKKEFNKRESEYQEIKGWLHPSAEKYLAESIKENPNVKVLHFDEVQKLMGHLKVSSANFDSIKNQVELRDFFMPVFCQVLEEATSDPNNPLFIMSGTSFFSPVQFNPGSAMKINDKFYLQGRFPPRWIIDILMPRYFDLQVLLEDPQCMPVFEKIIEHISANRRVVQYFLNELRGELINVSRKFDAYELLEIMKMCSSSALDRWTINCGGYTSVTCLTALGLCQYPEGYGGEKTKIDSQFPEEYQTDIKVVVLQRNKIPDAVQAYAESGGLNIWRKDEDHDYVEVPVGCLREYLLRKCRGLNPDENSKDIEAIKNYTRKVDPNAKGHLFERLLAYELTTFGSGVGDLLCQTLSTHGRKMVLDGRIFGSEWAINAVIIDKWVEGKVQCVVEDSKHNSQRIVDVGVPIINVAAQPREEWRVYCELKCGYQTGCLWKLCLDFFKKIKPELDRNPKCFAIFIASKAFLNCRVNERAETNQAKQKVLQATRGPGNRFFIWDGASLKNKSMLALTDLDPDAPINVRACYRKVREEDYYRV